MHIWIDIDKNEHIPFIAAVVKELKDRGHWITITAENSKTIKKSLEKYSLNVQLVGFLFSFFGFFSELSLVFRTTLLRDYIDKRKIDIAFSCGSKPMLYVCATRQIPLISFIEEFKEKKIEKMQIILPNSFFIVPENIHEQELVNSGFYIDRVAKYKGMIKTNDINPDMRSIKDIVSKIEYLNKHIGGEIKA